MPVIAYTNAFLPTVVEEAVKAGASKVFDKSKLTPPIITKEFEMAVGDRKCDAAAACSGLLHGYRKARR